MDKQPEAKGGKQIKCGVCALTFSDQSQMEAHRQTEEHKERVKVQRQEKQKKKAEKTAATSTEQSQTESGAVKTSQPGS